MAYRYNFLQALQGWFYGSFSLVIAGRFELIYFVVAAMVVAFMYAKAFTIAAVGETFATNLGLAYEKHYQHRSYHHVHRPAPRW